MNSHGQSKRTPAFHDLDKMPFGKHLNRQLQDVPPSYLKWLYEELKGDCINLEFREGMPFKDQQKLKLFNYIHNSMDAIEMEMNEDL